MKNPEPTLEELIQEYDDFYKGNPRLWDNIRGDDYTWGAISLYWRAARGREEEPAAILDVGCGSGHTIAYFLKRWPSSSYYGLDLSEEAVGFARNSMPNVHFLVGPLGKVEFQTKFDIIILRGVLEHFKDPDGALKDIGRLLSPGGFAFLEVPNCISYPESEKAEGFRQLACGTRQWEWHLFRQSWEERIKKSGLAINLSLKGPENGREFVWIAANEKRVIPIRHSVRIRIFEQEMLLREMALRFRRRLAGISRRIIKRILTQKAESKRP